MCKEALQSLNVERALLRVSKQDATELVAELESALERTRATKHEDMLTISRLRQEVSSLQAERARQDGASRDLLQELSNARVGQSDEAARSGELRSKLSATEASLRGARGEITALKATVEDQEGQLASAQVLPRPAAPARRDGP